MSSKIITLIIIWSIALTAWVLATPPPGDPGTTNGLLTASGGNIGINLNGGNPLTSLHIAGNNPNGVSVVTIENLSTGSVSAKTVSIDFAGRDTANTQKITGRIMSFPYNTWPSNLDNNNWIGAGLSLYTRYGNSNTLVERMRIADNGNVGIGVTAPAGTLDIDGGNSPAGRLIVRNGFINMTNNTIKNLPAPVNPVEAANKAYVDAQTGGANTTRIWGEGRLGVTVLNTAGECTNTIGASTIKISRSSRPATWGSAAAACPANWWVCGAIERDTNRVSSSFGTCGAGNRKTVVCDTSDDGFLLVSNEFLPRQLDWGWVSDAGSIANAEYGWVIGANGNGYDSAVCSMVPVWCCALQ